MSLPLAAHVPKALPRLFKKSEVATRCSLLTTHLYDLLHQFFPFNPPRMTTKPQTRSPTILDWFKPRKAEATARLRSNSIAAITIFLITHFVSVIPTPWTCIWFLMTGGKGMDWWVKALCWIGASAHSWNIDRVSQTKNPMR